MPRGGHGGISIGESGGHGSNSSGNHTGERSSFSSRGLGDGRAGKGGFHGSGDNSRENREKTRDRDREMVGGCCVCSDERGWDENPLVYCDGHGCNVAVHQACYGIVSVPTGPWFCRKCESQERAARVRCELCPNKDGGLKRTDTNSWAHVVCALYIPEVRFGNVSTMEPIVLGLVPQERYLKVCYLCEAQGRESRASSGACMQCNKSGCKQSFHVTCAQRAGLLCEEAGNYMDNVKYCGYCEYHYQRINKKFVKTVPAYRPSSSSNSVFDRISDDERNSPRSTSSPDQKRGNLDSELVNSTSNHASTKNMNNTSASLNCSTSSSNLSSSLGGGLLSSSLNDGKGDRGGGDSSSVVSSSSSSSKKGKKGRKPNSEKGSSGSNEGKVEPIKISTESLNMSDTPSTTSGQPKMEKGEITDNKNESNANKALNNHCNVGASSSNIKINDSSSSPIQNSKDLSTNSSVHGNSQNSTSTHINQSKDEAAKRSSPSLATVGISSKPSSEPTSDPTTNGNSISSTNSKPPSVIVKFGKQDGTYYSKKDPVSSQSTSNSSSSAIATSTISQPTIGSSNNSIINENSSNHDLSNKASSSGSQSYNHKDHRHGKKHSLSHSKGSKKDHGISTTDSSSLVSNNGLDSVASKKEEKLATNGPVDCTTSHSTDQEKASRLPITNDKHSLENSLDPYKKGFTGANLMDNAVTPTSSVSTSLFSKDSLPRGQSQHVSGSSYQEKEGSSSKMYNSHSSDRRNFPQASSGASSYSMDRYGHATSVTTSIVKSEPLDYGKNHDSLAASSSRTMPSTSAHHLEKNVLQDKPNVDLKITKYSVHDTSNGKSAQGYSSYNKHSYESSSMRTERTSSSSVTVSKSTHHVPEQKKDSPAKILPISASSTSPEKSGSGGSTPSFGRPLKVEVSSGNASRSSSLEVSPVKRTDDTQRKDLSPSKLSKDFGSKVSSKSSSGKRLGRPPKKGTHLPVNSLGHLASASAANATSSETNARKRSPHSSPERDSEEIKKRRKRSPSKRMTNGQRDSSERSSRDRLWMMMGATLNPNSSMADEMENVLKHEVQDHSVYDASMQPMHHQVPLPGGKRSQAGKSSSALSTANTSSHDGKSKDQPQTLDELLERQWEQGSQFLMEQASHFDIASLLSSLHQLKEENLDLEDSVDRMVQRRDHLLAVRARLLALSSLTVATPNNNGSQIGGSGSNQTTPERDRYSAAVAHQTGQSPIGGTTVVNVGTSNGPSPSSGRSSAHVSPRNSAATISPIRPGGGNALISPRAPPNLPPPPSSQVQMPPSIERSHSTAISSSNSSASIYMQPPPAHSPRDRISNRPPSGGPLGIAPPPSHQAHGTPSPRDRPTSSPRHLTSPHSRDSRMSPRVPSSTTVIHSGSAAHSTMPVENGVDYPHRGHHPGALPPPPHGAIPVSSPAPNLPPGTMIHPRDPTGHGDLGPPLQPRSGGPVSSSHLLSVASHQPSGRGVSINTTGTSGPPAGGVVVCSTYTQHQNSSSPSNPPPRQSSMSYSTSSGNIPGGPHGQHPAHLPPRSSPHHLPPPGANIHPSQRGVPPHIPSSLGGGATTIMTAVSSSIGPPHSSGLPPVPPRSTGGMMIRPMGSHCAPAGSGSTMGSSYRPGAPVRNYHGMHGGPPHGPPPPGHIGGPSRSPTPMNSQHASMRAQQGRMLGPPGGMMNIHPQDKR